MTTGRHALTVLTTILLIAGCASTSGSETGWFKFVQAIFGYQEPPKAESVGESLSREYDRCLKVDPNRNCVQIAYDRVRVAQGLDPAPIPEGYVVIVEDTIARKRAEQAEQEKAAKEKAEQEAKQAEDSQEPH